ncbi:bleomycin resistance protein, partial [Klebsiella pneumoniae]
MGELSMQSVDVGFTHVAFTVRC